MAEITRNVDIPVIASGGFGQLEHLKELLASSAPTGIAIADSLHYNRFAFAQIRDFCVSNGIATRTQLPNKSGKQLINETARS
jgi:cyclase